VKSQADLLDPEQVAIEFKYKYYQKKETTKQFSGYFVYNS